MVLKYTPVTIYTDGSCHPHNKQMRIKYHATLGMGRGSWAAVLIKGKYKKRVYGYNPNTTNNEMELYAAVKALSHLKSPCEVKIYSDSMYVVGQGNKNIGERRVATKTHKNLWKKIVDFSFKHKIEFVWVKGHAGNKYNEMCDKLCDEALARGKDECVDYNKQMRLARNMKSAPVKKVSSNAQNIDAEIPLHHKKAKGENLTKEEIKRKIKVKLKALIKLIDML